MLKLSYYGKDHIRHLTNKQILKNTYIVAICNKLATFTDSKDYQLGKNYLYPNWSVICPDCVNKLSKKKREYIIHKLIVQKLKGK